MKMAILNIFHKKLMLRAALVFLAFSIAVFFDLGVKAQQETAAKSNSNTDSVPKPSPTLKPTPIPDSAIIIQKEEIEKRLQEIEKDISENNPVSKSKKELEQLKNDLNAREEKDKQLLRSTPPLEILTEVEQEWRTLNLQILSLKARLQVKANERNKQQNELQKNLKVWEESLEQNENKINPTKTEKGEDVSKEKTENGTSSSEETASSEQISQDNELGAITEQVNQRIKTTIENIKAAQKKVGDSLSEILKLEEEVTQTQTKINDLTQKVKTAHDEALSRIVVRDSPPIWSSESLQAGFGRSVGKSITDKVYNLSNYVSTYQARILVNFISILFLVFLFHLVRRKTRKIVEREPDLENGLGIFESPVAIGVLLGIMFDSSIYPKMPELFDSIMNLIGLTAMFFLIKHFVRDKYYPILIAIFSIYLVDDFRSLFATIPFLSRVWFLAEMLGAIGFLIWLIRSKSLLADTDSAANKVIKNISLLLIPVFAFAAALKAIGYVTFAGVIGDTLIASILFGALYYVLVQFLISLLVFVFRTSPFSKLEMVKHHSPLIRKKVHKVLQWGAIFIWINITLSLLYISESIWNVIVIILSAGINIGSIQISIGSITAFILAVWLSFFISKLIRFVLEEDVYPRINLADGMPYAASTILHYIILLIGFYIALGIMRVDLTKFTVIAGAFGVGLGFGLKNIVENFTSGLILLFERPVKVGDVVEMDQSQGSLTKIGLRASIVRTVQGSDLIMPNADLITRQVTNWTLSDPLRRIDIEVGVEYGTDLEEVIELLERLGNKYSDPKIDIPAQALFDNFGDSSLNFHLRVWTTNDAQWAVLKSKLSIEIYKALDEAGIEIPFVQRDLHLKSIDENVADRIKLIRNEKISNKN